MSAAAKASIATTASKATKASIATASKATKAATAGASKATKCATASASMALHIAKDALPFVNNHKSADEYRWAELQQIEDTRRAILLWTEQPFSKILTHYNGTVIRFLVRDWMLYITLAVYIAVRLITRFTGGVPTFLDQLGQGQITVVGGFISFFLVFYVNQSHKRYFRLYDDSMKCKGRIFDVASIAVTTMPPARATRLVRYMNAAHAAGYTGLSETYPAGSFFRHINESLGLLTDRELQRMQEIDLDKGGSCNRELIVWCLHEIQQAKQKGELADPELVNTLRDHVLKLRAAIGMLYNAKDLPIPFFYVHFICLLTVMYLPLFAVTSAIKAGTGADVFWVADVVAGLVVFLQAIFVNGLRILGQQMSDPYGDDLVDLSVLYYVNFTWTHSNRILRSALPDDDEVSVAEEEAALEQQRQFLGAAWEPEIAAAKAHVVVPMSSSSPSDHDDTPAAASSNHNDDDDDEQSSPLPLNPNEAQRL